MKYPYERFLRFLVSRKIDPNQTLERFGLPRVGALWAADCRSSLRKTAPYAIVQYLTSTSPDLPLRTDVLEWATSEGFGLLWKMQREFDGPDSVPELDLPFRLFANPASRAVLGALLLSKCAVSEICAIVHEQFDLTLTVAALELYKSIFWDVSLVSRDTWGTLITSFATVEERNILTFAITGSPTANEFRSMLGMDCTAMDHRTILQQLIATSYIEYKRSREGGKPEDALKWAELALKSITTAKNSGSLITDDTPKTGAARFKGLFAVTPEQTKHATLADLMGEVSPREDKAKP